MDNNRIQHSDRRILNDFDKASDTAKEFHRRGAQQEAEGIASRHRGSPAYLKMLSVVLAELADKAYAKHQQQQSSTPEALARNQMRSELMEEIRSKPELMGEEWVNPLMRSDTR